MEYLLKASALLAIFYLSYKVFLQRETFFNQNRWFLILGILTAFVLPFLVIPIYVEYTPVDIPNFNNIPTEISENIETPFSILDYLPTIYLLGVIGFSIRFLIQLTALTLVISKSKKEKNGKYTYIKTHKNISPFSFFNWIVFNPKNFNNNELEQILIHEKIHANQKHSIDVLLTQLSCIALWFNPFIWFYNKALKQNLEFIADNETQHQIDCKKTYQITLLKTSLPSHQMALTNNFHTSLIKKRIVMLQKSKSNNINLLKHLLIMPLLCVFIMSFNTKEITINHTSHNDAHTTKSLNAENLLSVYINKDSSDDDLQKLTTKLKENGYTLDIKNIKRNSANNITSISITVSYKNSHNSNFKTNSPDPLKTIKITIDKKTHSITIDNQANQVSNIAPALAKALIQTDKNPLYVIDNKVITEKGFTLMKDSVKYINALKGESATEKYGDKGKNGVIEITTTKNVSSAKENGMSSATVTSYGKTSNTIKVVKKENNLDVKKEKRPLVYVDNLEIDYDELETIDQNTIKSMNVLKNENATEKYGEKAKHGVIEIYTKK
ncbi:M56 family metallopeptidase [Algibacter sp. Ld11]|uniref:M56 family metallopeptidase n=1 Tax=Algibacter sp. Ld11 TaxID=649150 RepID=UPI00386AB099